MRGVASLAFLLTVAVLCSAATASRTAATANCSRASVGLTPLVDLSSGSYQGFRGGLYPGGRNAPSTVYLKKGMAYVKLVKPRAADGRPSTSGRVVLLSIGMSNTTQEFSEFKRMADAGTRKSPSVIVVDGAQGGQDAERTKDPSAPFWSNIDRRLEADGVTSRQVQVAWVKQAIARPTEAFPADAKRLQTNMRAIVQIMRQRYPNLRLVYLSSRTYGGYATTQLNPEPYAYQSGFAVKWLVQERIEGKLKGPWLAWGPYLWTDGTKGRRDGLTWTCEDVREDGTHPSASGRQKVAAQLVRFFETSPTARPWFSRGSLSSAAAAVSTG